MIYLLRHGQTEYNLEGRYQGGSDSPLTALGRRQGLAYGERLADHLRDGEIWSSPLPRATDTAGLLAAALPGVPVRIDARLREISFGQWDGMTRAEIEQGWPGQRKHHPPRQWMFHAPGGEGLTAAQDRLRAVLHDAGQTAGDVILVSHGITGRLMRGLHAGVSLEAALRLDVPQDLIFRLHPGGAIDALPRTAP
ncbi:MAG TPA: histidine phosphatase family protein [Paenirhodobacter sp.]